MKKITYKEILLIILLLLYNLCYYPLATTAFQAYIAYFNVIFWVFIAIISYFLIGYVKCRKIVKKDTIQLIIIYTIIYLIFIYLLGIITGFANTPFSLKILSIIKNSGPFIIFIIAKELTRYILLKKNHDNKSYIYLVTIIYILIDIVTTSISYDFNSFNDIFRFVGVSVLGNSFKNILFSYISLNAGESPCIIYNLIMEGYIYIVPFVPNLGEYLETMALIFFPVMMILRLNKIYEDNKIITRKRVKIKKIYYQIPTIMILLSIIALVSGVFKYRIYAIASNSMKPSFSRGDIVIMENYIDNMEIKKDDIIAFGHDGKVYVHRVVKIRKYNNLLYYTTKGDNNSTNDNFEVSTSDIVGKVHYYLPLLGYPTIWLSEAID